MTSHLASKLKAAVKEHRSGNLAKALSAYNDILAKSPDHADALHLKGLAVFQSGGSDEAEVSIRRAIELRPGELEFKADLAAVLVSRDQIGEAERVCRDVLRIDQAHVPALTQLGTTLLHQRRLNDALKTFRSAATTAPRNASVLCNLASTLIDADQIDEAHDILLQARALTPTLPQVHIHLASVLRKLGDHDAALSSLDTAEQLHPSCEVFVSRGHLFLDMGRIFDAVEQFQTAIACDSSSASAVCGLGNTLQQLWQWEDSLEAHRLAAQVDSSDQHYQSNYLNHAGLNPLLTAQEVHRIHTEWGQRIEGSITVDNHLQEGNAEQPLRIGYVSPDFASRTCISCFQPILKSHERSKFQIFCYSEATSKDDTTAEIRDLADRWIPIGGLGDEELAEQLRHDRIDILVDLAGHTEKNRLPVFARKPAPVQVSFLGYPTTTGLTRIDYFLSDVVRETHATAGKFYSEQLALLPHGACCYQPDAAAPDVAEPPFQKNGYITFGSSQPLQQSSPRTFRLWADVMSAVPDSRLLLLSHATGGDESYRQYVCQILLASGIDTARVTFRDGPEDDHLATYSQIDMLLDVCPLGCGIVAFDAMWMGVPVPTIAGERDRCRTTASLLYQCELTELVAESDDEYIKIVSRLAGDTVRLRRLRQNMRCAMEKTVCNRTRFTRDLEAAYRLMWLRFLNGEAAAPAPLHLPSGDIT